jgi:double-stranded uracil-DNA glycosylase
LLKHCFEPVVRPDTRLVVLGSLPGALSLERRRYYAHPQNLFWRLMSGVIGRDLVPLDYETRLAALLDARVGLWDTVASAVRPGSMDADIDLHAASDLNALAAMLPELRAFAFNGAKAAKIGRAEIGARDDIALIDLPSSSPAYASMPYSRKAEAWRALSAFL